MLKIQLLLAATILSFASLASADTVVLRSGASYLGHLAAGTITFADNQGVKYEFPGQDVQSLVFGPTGDVVTLRSGKSYSGHFTGSDPVVFSMRREFSTSFRSAIGRDHLQPCWNRTRAQRSKSNSFGLRPLRQNQRNH